MSLLKGIFYAACFMATVLFFVDWYSGQPTFLGACLWPIIAGVYAFISDQQKQELKEHRAATGKLISAMENINVKLKEI